MTNTKGYRRGTRHKFSRDFRHRGVLPLSTYMRVYKFGDLVDIKGNGAIQKGMPFRVYHGRTGRVFNVTKHAVGVIVNKRVRNRIIQKRLCIRIEHVKPSTSQKYHRGRVQENDQNRRAAVELWKTEKKRTKLSLKRQPTMPRKGCVVKATKNKPVDIAPLPLQEML